MQSKKLKAGDDLREEAIALLLGIDARPARSMDFEGDDLVYDPTGKLLLIARTEVVDPKDPQRSPRREVVRIWNSATDDSRMPPQKLHDGYGSITFRADGTPLQLVWDQEDSRTLQLWDMEGQKAVRRFACPADVKGMPGAWTLTPGGEFAGVLMIGPGGDRRILAWETESAKLLRQFPTNARDLELSPDGSLVATSDLEGNITVWSLTQGEQIATLSSGHAAILCMAWARDYLHRAGESKPRWLLAAGSSGGDLTIWDVRAKIPRSYCRGSAYDVNRVAFSPDGMTLASVGRNFPILWDVPTGRMILRLGGRNSMSSVAFAPNGKACAIGSGELFRHKGGVDVWSLDEARGLQSLRGLLAPVSQVCYSRDGKLLAALAQNWQLAIWDLETHRLLHVFEAPKGRFADTAGLAFDSDGNRFAFAAGAGAKMWDVKTGAEIRSWPLQFGFLDQMVFQATDRLLLIRQESVDARYPPFGPNDPEKTPRVCRVRNLLGPEPIKPLFEIKDFPFNAIAIRVAPDGVRVVVEGFEVVEQKLKRVIKALDSRNGAELWSLRSGAGVDDNRIRSIDPTGHSLVMWDDTFSKVIMVDMGSGRQLRTFKYLPSSVGPGAKDCFSTWNDPATGTAKYSVVRGEDEDILVTLGVKRVIAFISQFSPDGSHLAWGNDDGSVTVCDIPRVLRRLGEVGLH